MKQPITDITRSDLQLLRVLHDGMERELAVDELRQVTGLSLSTTYSSITRLERIGWILGRLHHDNALVRPHRRYCLTSEGINGYEAAVRALSSNRLVAPVGGLL